MSAPMPCPACCGAGWVKTSRTTQTCRACQGFGTKASIKGKRAEVVIIDDPIKPPAPSAPTMPKHVPTQFMVRMGRGTADEND